MPKWILASRTVILNVVAAALVILNSAEVVSLFPADATATIVSIIAALNVVLRIVTSVPVTFFPPEEF